MRQKQGVFSLFLLSPSSRRAWIEIQPTEPRAEQKHVALLAEGVDRNEKMSDTWDVVHRSPSSRRAWIEIVSEVRDTQYDCVALLAEGVDRNTFPLVEAT